MKTPILNTLMDSRRRPYQLALTLSCLFCFTSFRFVSLLLVIFVVSRLIKTRLGAFSALFLGGFVVFCINSSLGAVGWVADIPLSSGLILALWSIALLSLSCVHRDLPRLTPSLRDEVTGEELIALLVSLGTAAVLLLPLGLRPTAAITLPIIAAGGDNASHLALVNLNDLNSGFSMGLINRVASYPVVMSYPQGWHFNAAFLKWTVEPMVSLANPDRLLLFFYALGVLWFCILAFFITRLSLLVSSSSKRNLRMLSALGSVIICAIAIVMYLIPIFVSGFQTHIAALALLLGELVFLIMAYEHTTPRRYGYFLLAGLVVVGITLTWQFQTPVAAIALLLCLIQTLRTIKKWPPLLFIVGSLCLAWFVLFQFVAQLLFIVPSARKPVSILNLSGYIPIVSMLPLFTGFLIISVFCYLQHKNKDLRITYMLAASAMVFSLALMAYQLSTIHELRYYYFKSTYTFIVLATVLLAAMFRRLFLILFGTKPIINTGLGTRLHRYFLAVITIIVGMVLFWSNRSIHFDDLMHGRAQGMSPGQAAIIADVIRTNPTAGYEFTSIGSCNRGDDIRATLFARALAYTSSTDTPVAANFELEPIDKNALFAEINEFENVHHKEIIIASNDFALRTELISTLGHNAKYVKFVDIDSTTDTEPRTQCPDRIRSLTLEEEAAKAAND